MVVPNNDTPVIILVPQKSVYDIGSNITLSCSVKYSKSPLIDLNTSLTLQWFNSSNDFLCASTSNNTEHTLNYTIRNIKLSDAGQYTCSVFINASVNNNAILDSSITSNFTNITILRKLQLKNKLCYYILS